MLSAGVCTHKICMDANFVQHPGQGVTEVYNIMKYE